jgi:DNA segregation ATPase FtsK/SpoIIIE, S-DNA-T family
MARNAQKAAAPRGLSDVIGIVLLALGLLLLVAQLSFDPYDLAAHRNPPNETPHNWIGGAGAWGANILFQWFGAGAFVLPFLLLLFGTGYLFEVCSHLQRRWAWAGVLFVSSLSFFELYARFLNNLCKNINAPSAGGYIGRFLNDYIFGHFGVPGATIIIAALYAISLLYLTNFRLGQWLRAIWTRKSKDDEDEDWSPEEKALARKARDLEKQARKLQEQVERSGLGADLKPVPTPQVRDLSIPQSRGKAKSKSSEPEPEPVVPEGEVITAREIAAATTEDILGKAKPAADEPAVAAAAQDPKIHDNTRSKPKRPKPIAVAAAPAIGNYQLPPLDFLQMPDQTFKPTESKEELMANARLMQGTLAQFGIEVALGDITKGPTITRYELHPAPGVKMERITALNSNIAAALKAERIHILAPVPGKSSVGVEVPNIVKTKVIMRDLLECEEWTKTKARVPLALGKDVYGHPIIADLADMPHLLIAGTTGSGKSVCINGIITSLLYRFRPDELRFVMIDPKVVELQHYNTLPHLVVPVVTDPKKVILALRWVVNEMEKRYQIFARVGVRNIKSFNERPKNKPLPPTEPELPLKAKKEKIEAGAEGFAVEVDEEIVVPQDEEDIVIPDMLSYIVVIIDELADLMLVAPADVEMAIARITQMARAAGIHCIVATQRPSVDVITGVIKANIPARIAFQVASRVDSRTILDAMGADKLLGKGDMLYLPPGSAKFIRAQGALITDAEIQSIVDFIAKQGKPSYELEIHQQLSKPSGEFESENGIDEDEDLIQQCIEVIRSEQKASVSLLQRRLRLGYTRAARIMDELENRGIVGPSKGAEPRDILIDLDGGGADGKPATA